MLVTTNFFAYERLLTNTNWTPEDISLNSSINMWFDILINNANVNSHKMLCHLPEIWCFCDNLHIVGTLNQPIIAFYIYYRIFLTLYPDRNIHILIYEFHKQHDFSNNNIRNSPEITKTRIASDDKKWSLLFRTIKDIFFIAYNLTN